MTSFLTNVKILMWKGKKQMAKTKKEKNYKVSTNVNGQIQVSAIVNGRVKSIASFKQNYTIETKYGEKITRVETKTQAIKRMCNILGVEY